MKKEDEELNSKPEPHAHSNLAHKKTKSYQKAQKCLKKKKHGETDERKKKGESGESGEEKSVWI